MEQAPRADLRRRCPFAAEVIAGAPRCTSPRIEARRTALLAALWASVPPEGADLARPWYVALAFARATRERLLELAHAAFPAQPISARTLDADLRWLVELGLVVRAPGDEHPLGRHADTLHLVRTPQEAAWWERAGAARLAKREDAARKARIWRRLFGAWRAEAREYSTRGRPAEVVAELPAPSPAGSRNPEEELRAAVDSGSRRRLLGALWRAGIRFRGGWRWRFARTFDRAAGAVALLLQRVSAVGWPRSPAGWLCAVWERSPAEASAALHAHRKTTAPPAAAVLEEAGVDVAALLRPIDVHPADADLERVRDALASW